MHNNVSMSRAVRKFSPVIHAGELNFNLHLGEFAYGQINDWHLDRYKELRGQPWQVVRIIRT